MALTFTSTAAGTTADYMRYLHGHPVKSDRKNEPDTLDFSLANIDGSFVKLVRGNYVKLNTVTYPNWFTGYIINEPELEMLGTNSSHAPVFGYRYKAVSDEYILNLKPIGIIPPFVNSTMGSIITFLANRLVPGKFNVTNVQAGIKLARFIPDPQSRFSDIVKTFCDNSQYRFRANNGLLYFMPQDTNPAGITIDGTSKHFSLSNLQLSPSTDPIINEALVLGDVEPQHSVNEYFYGDGLTGQFPLVASPYGVDRTILLNEDFSNGSLDGNVWSEFDNASDFLRIATGYLNAVGGNLTDAYDIYLQSQQLVPLSGNLRLTHGEYDFVNSGTNNKIQGIVASLWTGTPTRVSDTSFTGCVFGIRVARSAGGVATLNPIYSNTVDTGTSVTVDYTKRYIIRTIMNTRVYREVQKYNYITSGGSVASRGGDTYASTVNFTTVITEVSTTDGTQTNQWTWSNASALDSSTYYAYYCPVVSNDLHCTVSGITLSTPMQMQLEIKPFGGSFIQKLVGQNELDSLDNNAPVATVIDSNNGVQTRSTLLGTPQFNPGNAILTFFKDSTKQTATTPQKGDLIHVAYRKAGASIGKVRANSSVSTEGVLWGDNGVRTVVRGDLDPKPRTSADCEAAAAAIVGDSSYQHYQGSYTQFSTYFTAEPQAGNILPFANLPAGMPSVAAEEINAVSTTFLSSRPSELFEHVVSFGRPDVLSRFLAKFKQQTDVFNPQDTVEVPNYIEPASIANAYVEDVVAPTFTSMTASTLTFNTNQAPPSGGGFEVRYTDEGWGPDAGKNLISRASSQVITVPRNYRSRVCYIKAYDVRNKVRYSEDCNHITEWPNASVSSITQTSEVDPDGDIAQINTVALTSGNGISCLNDTSGVAVAGQTWTFAVTLKGTSGNTFRLWLNSGNGVVPVNTTFTLNGQWQRFSVSGTFNGTATANVSGFISTVSPTSQTIKITRAQLEQAASETVYCRTNGTSYGALSRFPSILRVNFPAVPPAPTATLVSTVPTAPVITVTLPATQQDVWGMEIRASDNSTVLYSKDLSAADFNNVFTVTGNASRSLSYFVYTYNLLTEYSTAYNATATIPTPAVSGTAVDDGTKTLSWSATNASSYSVVIDSVDATYTHRTTDVITTDKFLQLTDADFFPTRYIRVTPIDSVGNGTAANIVHVYTATGTVVDQSGSGFNTTNNVQTVIVPINPSTDPVYPSQYSPYTDDLLDESWSIYQRKGNRK